MTFRVERLVFKNGPKGTDAPLTLEPSQITLFIGPNNGGKSRAIFEIRNALTHDSFIDDLVLNLVSYREITRQEVDEKIESLKTDRIEGDHASEDYLPLIIQGERSIIHLPSLHHGLADPNKTGSSRRELYKLMLGSFTSNLDGVNRLTLTEPKPGQRRDGKAKTTIAKLFADPTLLQKLTAIFFKAFGRYLVIDPTEMVQLSYRIANTEPIDGVQFSLSDPSQEFFRDTQPVKSASDGTKAFTGIMAEIISGEKEVFFIDEPEAFLHPSLAGILGTEISRNLGRTSQLFVATHSPEFLLGCVASGKQIDVVRLTYDGSLGTAQLLHKDQLKKLFHDPLLRSADVVSGLFHGGAVVVEADNDRAFYGEIFHRLTSSEDVRARNVRFMNAQNKQTMPSISEFLRSMGVPAAMIFDLDWIKEDGEVCRKYLSGALIPQGLWDGFRNQRSAIRSTLEVANPDYKRAGGLRNLTGDDLASASAFLDTMEEYGIFTVRSGELESWLPQLAVGRNKNGWVPRIFEAMGSDPEDPNYIKPDADDVWNFIRRVNAWISRPDRKGM